ncbi:MAG: hypothetical protein R3B91_00680 [Planctomycetaceae bacterium]
MTRRRDKTQMAADVSIALSSKLSDTAKFIVMKNVIWEWSLNDRKKPDCQIVSAGVDKLAQGFDLKDVRADGSLEHIVPICVIQEICLLRQQMYPNREEFSKSTPSRV